MLVLRLSVLRTISFGKTLIFGFDISVFFPLYSIITILTPLISYQLRSYLWIPLFSFQGTTSSIPFALAKTLTLFEKKNFCNLVTVRIFSDSDVCFLHTRMRKNSECSKFGGDEEDRTPDPLLARQVLSQLSYTPKFFAMLRQNSSTYKRIVFVVLPCLSKNPSPKVLLYYDYPYYNLSLRLWVSPPSSFLSLFPLE